MQKDRVGLGWRPELASGILGNLDRIDILEVIGNDYVGEIQRKRDALKLLARQVPLHIHGVDLGLAGAEEVSSRRIDRLARLINHVQPEAWSEHLAFVRAGGIEIGHLAAPPRTQASIENAAKNLKKAAGIVGCMPYMENIATLLQPPCSSLSEQQWISGIAGAGDCGLLLDLHNLYANATNFSFDPLQFLAEIPLERVRCIHIAGGRWIPSPDGSQKYLLDDHLHEVTDPVYGLLSEVAARAAQPLTVILERDGAYPPMEALLRELERARSSIAAGRQRRQEVRKEASHAA
jgi:uncharacterized protein (UPF0276 family)